MIIVINTNAVYKLEFTFFQLTLPISAASILTHRSVLRGDEWQALHTSQARIGDVSAHLCAATRAFCAAVRFWQCLCFGRAECRRHARCSWPGVMESGIIQKRDISLKETCIYSSDSYTHDNHTIIPYLNGPVVAECDFPVNHHFVNVVQALQVYFHPMLSRYRIPTHITSSCIRKKEITSKGLQWPKHAWIDSTDQ